MKKMEEAIKCYIEDNYSAMMELLKELCHIPAPSHHEEKRAEYLKAYFEKMGAKGTYIDEALNVIFPINCEGSNEITVFAAHTDTVFPDSEPMPYTDDGEKIHCPGCADDTASVAVLTFMAKFFIEKDIKPEKGIMFVCNSCEEGLGNLKGTRKLFSDFSGRIKNFITFDSTPEVACNLSVGSHRYEVTVKTGGGHSFQDFGNLNAINELSGIVRKIYEIKVPEKEGAKTTYNVGDISGGTSVNTIAQSARMLCEYRSDDKDCLAFMEERFKAIFEEAKSDKVEITVEKVGDRPCGNVERSKIAYLEGKIIPLIEKIIGKEVRFVSGSTDCNIPHSLGVGALCIGVDNHKGIHTREEWVEKASLKTGLEIAIKSGLALMEG